MPASYDAPFQRRKQGCKSDVRLMVAQNRLFGLAPWRWGPFSRFVVKH
jgi:hypothetical protein